MLDIYYLLQANNRVCEVNPNLFWGLMYEGGRFFLTNLILWFLTQAFFRM